MDAWLRPSEIRFMQDTISRRFQNNGSVNLAADNVCSGRLRPEDFPKIQVVTINGNYFSFDNRRLYVFRVAEYRGVIGVIEVKMASLSRFIPSRLTTKSGGREVEVRGAVTYKHCKPQWLKPPVLHSKNSLQPVSIGEETLCCQSIPPMLPIFSSTRSPLMPRSINLLQPASVNAETLSRPQIQSRLNVAKPSLVPPSRSSLQSMSLNKERLSNSQMLSRRSSAKPTKSSLQPASFGEEARCRSQMLSRPSSTKPKDMPPRSHLQLSRAEVEKLLLRLSSAKAKKVPLSRSSVQPALISEDTYTRHLVPSRLSSTKPTQVSLHRSRSSSRFMVATEHSMSRSQMLSEPISSKTTQMHRSKSSLRTTTDTEQSLYRSHLHSLTSTKPMQARPSGSLGEQPTLTDVAKLSRHQILSRHGSAKPTQLHSLKSYLQATSASERSLYRTNLFSPLSSTNARQVPPSERHLQPSPAYFDNQSKYQVQSRPSSAKPTQVYSSRSSLQSASALISEQSLYRTQMLSRFSSTEPVQVSRSNSHLQPTPADVDKLCNRLMRSHISSSKPAQVHRSRPGTSVEPATSSGEILYRSQMLSKFGSAKLKKVPPPLSTKETPSKTFTSAKPSMAQRYSQYGDEFWKYKDPSSSLYSYTHFVDD